MANHLCEVCCERSASVFVTKVVGDQTTRHSLCEPCARRFAGDVVGLSADAPLDELMRTLFEHPLDAPSFHEPTLSEPTFNSSFDDYSPAPSPVPQWLQSLGEFSADEDVADEESETMDDLELGSSTHSAAEVPSVVPSVRCPKCTTTWDRLKQDGRAGCSQCYATFANELAEVMERVQKASQHGGKTPRALEKRQRRLMHLRVRRDNRLEMLNRRLQESVAEENYEEAARLRDKIRVVSSTIVDA